MRWWSNLIGSVAILAVISGFSLGLPAIDHALPDDRALPPGIRVTVGNGVTVLPPGGAYRDTAQSSPKDGRLVLELSGVRYALRAYPYLGSTRKAAHRLRSRIAAQPDYQLSGELRTVETRDGVSGLAGRFSSPRHDGYFAVFVHSGRVVEVVAQGSGLALASALPAIRDSVATIRFEVPSA